MNEPLRAAVRTKVTRTFTACNVYVFSVDLYGGCWAAQSRSCTQMSQNILKYFGKYGLTEASHSRSTQRGILEFFENSIFCFLDSFIQATELNILRGLNFYLRIPWFLRFSKKYRDHLKWLSARRVVRPTNVKRKSRKISLPGDLAPKICAPVMQPGRADQYLGF